jgi:hypothetical protein
LEGGYANPWKITEDTWNSIFLTMHLACFPGGADNGVTIRYGIKKRANDIRLDVFNATGTRVLSFDEGAKTAGAYEGFLDNHMLRSGFYLVRLIASDEIATSGTLLLR